MPIRDASELSITPTDTGSMVEVPADMPDGHYRCAIECRDGNDDDGHYRLFIGFKVTEVIEVTQPGFMGEALGCESSIMVTFYPEEHQYAKMNKQEVKRICDALEIDEPDTSSLKEGDNASLADWVNELESLQVEIWSRSKLDKNDVMRTKIFFKQPGKKLEARGPSNGVTKKPENDTDEEVAEETKPEPAKKSRKK